MSVLLIEHFYFRRNKFSTYDITAWDQPSRLPLGYAALASCALSFALVIPSMSQAWYIGPIGAKAGDLGFEFALAISAILYVPLRTIEKRYTHGR